ncbi:hypothetical protein [Laspinema palackyanum]|uniref:hypothetical protein n=1 Tax=Laspinema palackyanum TaxID=3231601 RepID=UPI00345D6137|nr:hypothetical protein [Laspinema sp. D2c]
MSYLRPSNLLLACLLGAKASLFLIAPTQSILGTTQGDGSENTSSIEVEVVNLSVNSAESFEDSKLVADTDVDRNQDLNQDVDQDQNSGTQQV